MPNRQVFEVVNLIQPQPPTDWMLAMGVSYGSYRVSLHVAVHVAFCWVLIKPCHYQ